MTQMVSLSDFLTDSQIAAAVKIAQDYAADPTKMVNKLEKDIMIPNIEQIDRKLGQKNNPRFMAYMAAYVFSSAGV